jgi:hypothetical protein
MNALTVIRVEPFSEGSESASVTLRSVRGEITVFSYPCEVNVGDVIPNHLYGMSGGAQAAYLGDWPDEEKQLRSEERLEKTGPFAYRGCGHVVDKSSGTIEVLGFHVELGEVPCDGPIEFECERIDL